MWCAKGVKAHGSGWTEFHLLDGDVTIAIHPSHGRSGEVGCTRLPRRGTGRRKTGRSVILDKPPGLATRQPSSFVEAALKKGWGNLSKDVQAALKDCGIDFTPEPELQPLEEILKAHFEALPKEVKEAVEGLLKPPHTAPVDVTGQLKATIGELRQLSHKKPSLQKKVDNAKEHYKNLLDEFKTVQEAIDRGHKQLGDQSGAYAKQLKEEALPGSPAPEHVLDPDTTEHVMKAMGQASFLPRTSRKSWNAILRRHWPSAERRRERQC